MNLKEFILEASGEGSEKKRLEELTKKIREIEKEIKKLENKEDISKQEKATLRTYKKNKDGLEKEKAELASNIGKKKTWQNKIYKLY